MKTLFSSIISFGLLMVVCSSCKTANDNVAAGSEGVSPRKVVAEEKQATAKDEPAGVSKGAQRLEGQPEPTGERTAVKEAENKAVPRPVEKISEANVTTNKKGEAKVIESKPEVIPQKTTAAAEGGGPKDVVAEIGEYVVTRSELEQRMLRKMMRDPDEEYGETAPVDANKEVTELLVEKAMMIEGRKAGYLTGDTYAKKTNDQELVRLLLAKELEGKVKVTAEEIDAKLRTDPNMDRKKAEQLLGFEKGQKLFEAYYNEIIERRHVEKKRQNFARAVQVHERLASHPTRERRGFWIMRWQMDEELSSEEKSLVMATFDGGQVTLLNWFLILDEISPINRPKNLDTEKGVEVLLDRALRLPLLVAEAKSLGLDKNADYIARARKREDDFVLGKAKTEALKGIAKPTDKEIEEYFNSHKDEFKDADSVTVDEIWCKDLKTAQAAKAAAGAGKEFGSVRKEYSLKEVPQRTVTSVSEGIFFRPLWAAEPNAVVGPIKGLYVGGGPRGGAEPAVKWRVVKVIAKKKGDLKSFSKGMSYTVAEKIKNNQRKTVLAKYGQELLEKYPQKIYAERVKEVDPLNIP